MGSERNFSLFLSVDVVTPRPDVSLLTSNDEIFSKALDVVFKGDGVLDYRSLYSFSLLYGFVVLYFYAIHLTPQPDKLQHDFTITLVLHQTNDFLVGTRLNGLTSG